MFSTVIRFLVSCGFLAGVVAQAAPVDFSLHAPDAKEVLLAGEMTNWAKAPVAMHKDDKGVWHTRLDLAAGQWVYKFVVDGKWITDPVGSQNDADGQGGRHSFVFVGDGDWYPHPGVAQGKVVAKQLPSKAWGEAVKMNVYLPPGFQRGKPYPVLLLLHGYGMDADQWFRTGQIHHYMDNLLAQGLIRPFVIVMPSSKTTPYTEHSERFLVEEMPRWLRTEYGLAPQRAKSAVAGMSMGGFGAFHLAQSHPDRYGLAVSLSGAYSQSFIQHLPSNQRQPFAFIQLCGDQDEWLESNRALARALQSQGRWFYYREDEGGHSFQYWSHRIPEMLLAADAYFSRGYSRRNEDTLKLPAAEAPVVKGQPVVIDEALWPRLLGKWQGEWQVEGSKVQGRLEQTLIESRPGYIAGRFSAYDTPYGDKLRDIPFGGAVEIDAKCIGCLRYQDEQGNEVVETIRDDNGTLWRQWSIRDHGQTILNRVHQVAD